MARAKKAKPEAAPKTDVSNAVAALAYLIGLGHDPASLPQEDAALVELAQKTLADLEAASAGAGANAGDASAGAEGAGAGEDAGDEDDDAEGEGAAGDAEVTKRHVDAQATGDTDVDADGPRYIGADFGFEPGYAVEAHLTENTPVKYKPHGTDVAVVERLKVWIGETANMFSHLECEEGSEVEDLVENMKHATRELSQRF